MSSVLIIEDNEVNLKLLCSVLEVAGYDIVTAKDARTGIALARSNVPDVILMDIQLPDMDGLQATDELRTDAKTAAIPIIAVTAHAMKGDQQRFLASGCDAYVAKPIRYKALLKTVKEVLEKR